LKGGKTLLNVEKAIVKKKTLEKVVQNREYNKIIQKYYEQLAKEYQYKIDLMKEKPPDYYKNTKFKIIPKKNKILHNRTITNKIRSIKQCNKLWNIDRYDKSKVKDFKSTVLCKDKFCANCKKVKQSSRMGKYIPEIQKYPGKQYFLTLTQPNVVGKDLKETISKMSKAYQLLNRILSGHVKIRGINLQQLNYLGGVRSLEVTYKKNDYHPHFHVILILDNEYLVNNKHIINKYSYDYLTGKKVLKCKFDPLEVLIQKIWYLALNNKSITKKNIDNLELGYSCRMDKLKPNDFLETFKYMTKEKDEDGNILTYENFKTLYYALYRVKQIQGYGCLYHIKDTIDMDVVEEEYNKLLEQLKKIEAPASVFEKPSELLLDKEYELISRKSYMKYYNKVMSDN
jgi:plasmid rolling circle replication initiator protein Rep